MKRLKLKFSKMDKFSVIISVYKNDKPEFVKVALDSIIRFQSICPSEVVLIVDGLIEQGLNNVVETFEREFSSVVRVIRLKENKGLGNALRLGVNESKFDIVARMDSDDISAPDRFEKQLLFLRDNPEVDIVGGQMTEFIGVPENMVGLRSVPLQNNEIYKNMRSRCALNHVTVMFRKKAVLAAGNYQDCFWNEDYYLWVRMMGCDCHFANLPDTLVNVRVGVDMYSRRGGYKYFKSERWIQRLLLKKGMISYPLYVKNIMIRFIVQMLMPSQLRGWVFRKFARRPV